MAVTSRILSMLKKLGRFPEEAGQVPGIFAAMRLASSSVTAVGNNPSTPGQELEHPMNQGTTAGVTAASMITIMEIPQG